MTQFKPHTVAGRSAKLVALVGAAACCALLLGSFDTEAKGAKGPKATFVKGEVETSSAQDGTFKKLKRNRRVKAGHFVRTGPKARAELQFADGSVVRIGPSSTMHVGAVGFDSKSKAVNVETTLVGGKAWANVSKLVGSEAKFKVKTENAVAGVRGTVFRVNIARDKASVVKVYNGAVAVSNSPFFKNKADDDKPADAVSPIKKDRKLLAVAPFEKISKKEFEQVVAKMMQVTVRPDGTMAAATAFTEDEDKVDEAEAEWVNWNLSCDTGECADY